MAAQGLGLDADALKAAYGDNEINALIAVGTALDKTPDSELRSLGERIEERASTEHVVDYLARRRDERIEKGWPAEKADEWLDRQLSAEDAAAAPDPQDDPDVRFRELHEWQSADAERREERQAALEEQQSSNADVLPADTAAPPAE